MTHGHVCRDIATWLLPHQIHTSTQCCQTHPIRHMGMCVATPWHDCYPIRFTHRHIADNPIQYDTWTHVSRYMIASHKIHTWTHRGHPHPIWHMGMCVTTHRHVFHDIWSPPNKIHAFSHRCQSHPRLHVYTRGRHICVATHGCYPMRLTHRHIVATPYRETSVRMCSETWLPPIWHVYLSVEKHGWHPSRLAHRHIVATPMTATNQVRWHMVVTPCDCHTQR